MQKKKRTQKKNCFGLLLFFFFRSVVLLSYVYSSVWRFVSGCARVRSRICVLYRRSFFFTFYFICSLFVTFPRPPLHCHRYFFFGCIGRQRLNTFSHIVVAGALLFFCSHDAYRREFFFLVASPLLFASIVYNMEHIMTT